MIVEWRGQRKSQKPDVTCGLSVFNKPVMPVTCVDVVALSRARRILALIHCAAILRVVNSSRAKECSMRELRVHGRGGQGAVIASKVLAVAFFRESHWVQSFPAFGVERRGAPVTAFLRVSSRPIRLRCEVQAPDDLIVLDPTLIGAVDVTAGLKLGGGILINSPEPPSAYPDLLRRFRVATVDASGVAAAHGIGSRTQPIVNTAILGAFASWSQLVSLEAVCAAIAEEVPVRADANTAAAREAAAAVMVEVGEIVRRVEVALV
jgi:2-oxoisovalerate/pyruvate ferredoxin oxidoreductase gamma subunit